MNWKDARETCADNGDHLTSIESQKETDDINKVLYSEFSNPKNEKFWIGLDEMAKEDRWVWTDHKSVGYTNWDRNQPGDHAGDEDCVAIGWGKMMWHDAPCRYKMYPVCEIGAVKPHVEIEPEEPVKPQCKPQHKWDQRKNRCVRKCRGHR